MGIKLQPNNKYSLDFVKLLYEGFEFLASIALFLYIKPNQIKHTYRGVTETFL